MEFNKLTDRIYYLSHEPEFDRPLLGYVKGDKYALMVDAGSSRKHVEKYYQALKITGLRKPDYTAITHWHWDHTFGMEAVAGITIANKITNEKLAEMSAWEWTDEAMENRLNQGIEIEFGAVQFRKEYENTLDIRIVTSDISFDKEMYLDLGGVTAVLKHTEAPHSEDSVIVYIPEERIVFIGDSTSEDFYNNNYYDQKKLNSLIHFLENLEFTYCLLGHADPVSKNDILTYLKSL